MSALKFLRRRAGSWSTAAGEFIWICGLFSLISLAGCNGPPSRSLVDVTGTLQKCPPSPNCVCSEATDPDHAIEPIRVVGPPEEAFKKARDVIRGWNRCSIVRFDSDFLHAECKSAVFRFVDDLELELKPDRHEIAVRSASRVGHSDFGVNRRRVERLREALIQAGFATPEAQPQ